MISLSPLNERRLKNFRKNSRAVWSLRIFMTLFILSLFAEFLANDKPILVSYRGDIYTPVTQFYSETTFGGDFKTEATYRDPEVQCLIRSGGLEICFDNPEKYLQSNIVGFFNILTSIQKYKTKHFIFASTSGSASLFSSSIIS